MNLINPPWSQWRDRQTNREWERQINTERRILHPPLPGSAPMSISARIAERQPRKMKKKKKEKGKKETKQNKIFPLLSQYQGGGVWDGAVGTVRMTSCLLLPLPHWGCELSSGIKPSMCEGTGALWDMESIRPAAPLRSIILLLAFCQITLQGGELLCTAVHFILILYIST